MMNDKFSAELRRHLLDTANERPADGQLAAVIEGVATTRQRHPIVARLSWTPGRIGPLPSAVLRYGIIAAALIGAALAGALIGTGGGSSRGTVFEGTWTSTDPGDGSGQILIVGSGLTPAVYFEDAYASGAACVADAIKRFTADGSGAVVDGALDVKWPAGGGCGLMTVAMLDGHYDYDPDTDTLLDGDGLRWTRMGGGEVRPSQRVATAPLVATQLPDPTPDDTTANSECIDLTQGGTYAAPTGPLSVIATVPETPLIAWQGWPTGFLLSSRCGAEGPISLVASTAAIVQATSCMPDGAEITSFADAVARLDTPTGTDISERVNLIVGGHPAARYDIVDLSSCPGGFGLWDGTTIGAGETGSIYVIDVDGLLVAIELQVGGSLTPAALEEVSAIVESLQFAAGSGSN